MKNEQRKFPRRTVSLSTNILEHKSKNILGQCLLTDISKNGFAFESETNFSMGQVFNLKFIVLHQHILLCGKIIRISNGFFHFHTLYGVQIIDKECKNLDFFKKYLDYYLIWKRINYENN